MPPATSQGVVLVFTKGESWLVLESVAKEMAVVPGRTNQFDHPGCLLCDVRQCRGALPLNGKKAGA